MACFSYSFSMYRRTPVPRRVSRGQLKAEAQAAPMLLLRQRQSAGRLRSAEECFQNPQIAISHDLADVLFRSHKSGSHPAPDHRAVLPVTDAKDTQAHTRLQALHDNVGGRQAAIERRRYAEPVDGVISADRLRASRRGRDPRSILPPDSRFRRECRSRGR